MKLCKNLETLIRLFQKFVPNGTLFDFCHDGEGNFIILYKDEKDKVTPWRVHHMNEKGLYGGHYETDLDIAEVTFDELKYRTKH